MEQNKDYRNIYIYFIKGLSAYGQTAFQKGCSVEGPAKGGRVMAAVGPITTLEMDQGGSGSCRERRGAQHPPTAGPPGQSGPCHAPREGCETQAGCAPGKAALLFLEPGSS